jgi:type IV pilus assembly protein PilY1
MRLLAFATGLCTSGSLLAQTPLADQPVFTVAAVPGNLALTLSVEFPTALGIAHTAAYATGSEFLGYFDPKKCYTYTYNSGTPLSSYFQPAGTAAGHVCSGKWSGNFLNWATMQTVDPFRWALTGGFRSTDTASMTVLERAYNSGQSGTADRALSGAALIAGATPMSWAALNIHSSGLGAQFQINGGGGGATANLTSNAASAITGYYNIYAHVRVCDASAGAGGLEANCKQYGSSYKPEGLIQQYSDRMRYSAFGYLNDSSVTRDGGVLRARQKFVGPTQPVPGSSPITNPLAEWSTADGIMLVNPDSADASSTATAYGTAVVNSGVMNYLNKFGSITRSSNSYKTYDPVSELYYAALRYYRHLGNVPEWSNARQTNPNAAASDIATYVDGFPVITNWDDPIQYACQKNYILGIGDVNTHADRDLPGATGPTEPAKPSAVAADTTVNATTATNAVGAMQGIANLGSAMNYPNCCNNNGPLIAGLAYDANAGDIRPDNPSDPKTLGRQSVQTYWLDVLETGFIANNQYYLATKYGGFTVPDNFKPYSQGSQDIAQSWWHTGAATDVVGSQLRPDNYYTANRPDLMVAGLTNAFASIANKLRAFTTSFSTASSQIVSTTTGSYAAQYDGKNWTGDVVANTTVLDAAAAVPAVTQAWNFAATLAAQASDNGWNTGRTLISYNNTTRIGVPFRAANLDATQMASLDTSYRSGNDSSDYLNYLRGDRSQEQSSTVAGSSLAYRTRINLLGDIVNSKTLPVAAPAAPYSEDSNPGYAAFKAANAARRTMVYVGANDGMVHAVDGSLSGATAGKEVFAYVPAALFSGPNNTPSADGLAALGNPNFVHHFYVDSTPVTADVDFKNTVGGSSAADWRTILVGGLGKGGKAFYALDVTKPDSITSEAVGAGKVLWEFTDSDLGYSYGAPAIAKLKKYGWVVMFASGYNNASGIGYLYIVNPRNGALLEKISTGTGSATAPAGMAAIQTFLLDTKDGTSESVYAGDLLGNVWRFDLTGMSGSYPAPTRLALLTDAAGNALSVTSRPLVMIQPGTNRRYVTVGTGRMLATSDVANSQIQTFFAIIDGTASRPNTTAALPSSITFPIRRSNLHQLTDLTKPVTLDLTREVGWYVDLGSIGSGPGWRVISDPSGFLGSVIFSTMVPSSSSACSPSGQSHVYAIDLGSGQSMLPSNMAYLATPSVVTDLVLLSVNGTPKLIIGTDDGKSTQQDVSKGAQLGYQLLNWREIPIRN